MQLDLSSIEDPDHSPNSSKNDQLNRVCQLDDIGDIEEMGLDVPDFQRFAEGIKGDEIMMDCNRSGQQSSIEDFKKNIREILFTANGEKSSNVSQKKEQSENEEFGEPLKGSFLQQMSRLCKTLSFQSTVYNVYDPEHTTPNLKQTPQQVLPMTSNFLQSSRQMLKTRFFWEVPVSIQDQYIVDFSKCPTKPKDKKKFNKKSSVDFHLTNIDLSKNTIVSTNSMKYSKKKEKSSNCLKPRNGSNLDKKASTSKHSSKKQINKKPSLNGMISTIGPLHMKGHNSPLKKISCLRNSQTFQQPQEKINTKKKISSKFKL